jgi:cell division protein FtsB
MSKNEWKKWMGGMGRLLLAFAFIFGQSAWAGQNQKANDKVDSPQKSAAQQTAEKQPSIEQKAQAQAEDVQREPFQAAVTEEKSSRDGSHEGIKVHGHWTIEVRNPDGRLINHREFENSLTAGVGNGNTVLANLLARLSSVSYWGLTLGGNVCQNANLSASACDLVEPGISSTPAPAFFPTLNVSANGGNFVITGTATAQLAGTISSVQSFVYTCNPNIAPATPCTLASAGFNGFTSAALGTPIQVSAGQTIAVTVNISFS